MAKTTEAAARVTLKSGDWIEVKDPADRIFYGGLYKVERVGRANVLTSCDVRFAPNGPIFHQEHRIPLAHVVRVVPPEQVKTVGGS